MQNKASSTNGLLVATGSSLIDIPLSFLQGYRTYSANGILQLEGFIPSHYFCADTYFLENNWESIKEIAPKTDAWIRWPFHAKLGYNARPLHRIKDHWSYEPDVLIGLGNTVMYQCMQVAYWHGIQNLLIVGLDHDYFEFDNGLPKHFTDEYQQNAENHPQLRVDNAYGVIVKGQTERAYQVARDVFEDDGRRIINLTEGTQCDVFEKGDIKDWMEE